MKAFLCSLIAILVVAIGAGMILNSVQSPSAQLYQSHKGSVRL
ncbi:hypothetical protein [Oceanibaculum pacificum]|nr:hypothetical protein [Oceanibaculum pacificum]